MKPSSSRGPTVAVILSVACVAALGMNRMAVSLGLVGIGLLVWSGMRRPPSKALLRAMALLVSIGFGLAPRRSGSTPRPASSSGGMTTAIGARAATRSRRSAFMSTS